MLKLGGVYETCHTKIVVQDKRLYNFIQIRKKIIKKKKKMKGYCGPFGLYMLDLLPML
jgi:hypothetical protein